MTIHKLTNRNVMYSDVWFVNLETNGLVDENQIISPDNFPIKDGDKFEYEGNLYLITKITPYFTDYFTLRPMGYFTVELEK